MAVYTCGQSCGDACLCREELAQCDHMILGSDSHSAMAQQELWASARAGLNCKAIVERTYDIPAPQVVLCHLSGAPQKGVGPEDILL